MNEYRDVHASILKFCTDFSAEMVPFGHVLSVENLDAFAEPNNWPNRDLIGPKEFHISIDEKVLRLETMIIISTINDRNLFRLAELVNYCLNHFLPGKALPLYDAVSGAKRGQLIVANGTEVVPPLAAEARTMQPIMVNLISDRAL